jgi:hypothetical protein
LLEESAFHFPYFSATQAGDVNVIAQAVTFVIVLIAADVEEVKLVNQADALEHIDRAIDGDAVDVRVNFLRAFENCACIQMLVGAIHYLHENTALASQANFLGRERGLQAAGTLVSVDTFAAGDALSAMEGHGLTSDAQNIFL